MQDTGQTVVGGEQVGIEILQTPHARFAVSLEQGEIPERRPMKRLGNSWRRRRDGITHAFLWPQRLLLTGTAGGLQRDHLERRTAWRKLEKAGSPFNLERGIETCR